MTSDLLSNSFIVVAFTFVCSLTDLSDANSDAYSDIVKLTRLTIDNPDFNKDLRPLLNQSHTMEVMFNFSVVSLVSVDDVTQSCTVNGFLLLSWMDELLNWNASDYGGFEHLQTQPYKIWYPRLTLMNAIGEREILDGNGNPMMIGHNGNVLWAPGDIFSAAIEMDIRKFPFDEQICELFFCPMDYFTDKLVFVTPNADVSKAFFHGNKGWWMTRAVVSVTESRASNGVFSCPSVQFHLKRRPECFLFNILAPVLMLSFINLFVFTIPAESGEKISYGITVLVAMSVYLSQVNSMLPSDSDRAPAVMMYLFFLMVHAVLSVLVSIATVYLHDSKHSKEEEEEQTVNQRHDRCLPKRSANRVSDVTIKTLNRRRHWILKHINRISIAIFLISWIILSLWYFIDVTI